MKIRSISSASGFFALCILASPAAFAVDWQTALMDQINTQSEEWVQTQAAAAVEEAKLSGIVDSLSLGKVYDDALAKAQDSIAAQIEVQLSQTVSWAPDTIPTTYTGEIGGIQDLGKYTSGTTSRVVNVNSATMSAYKYATTPGAAARLYGGTTAYKNVSSISKLLGGCQSQYVTELGKSACGDVSLSALESFLSKL